MRCLLAPLALVFAFPAAAQDSGRSKANLDHCVVEAKKGDRVAKGEDVVVASGESVEDAVAVEGNVYVRGGAKAKNAIALYGSVSVDSGGRVAETAMALGGKVKVASGGKVEGSRISLDEALHIAAENGTDVNVALSVGGKSLARELLKPMLAKFHDCGVISAQ
jgi:hypothetical protein